MPKTHPRAIRQEAVALASSGYAISRVCELVGVSSPNTIRAWVAEAESDDALPRLSHALRSLVEYLNCATDNMAQATSDIPSRMSSADGGIERIVTPRDQDLVDIDREVRATIQNLEAAAKSAQDALRRVRFYSLRMSDGVR